VAALAAGIVVAVMRLDEEKKEKAGPEPTVVSPEPTLPSPTVETPESPISPEPTDESPSPEPTTEPTESPSPEPSPTDDGGGGGNNGNGDNGDVLAQTGGPILPYFLGGALMLFGSAGLWRLRRLFD
jgi:hypothetical protein